MRRKLTGRQQRILESIDTYMNDKHVSPTVREIGELVGLKSSSSVHNQLKTLTEMGFIVKNEASPRTIRLTSRYEELRETGSTEVKASGVRAQRDPHFTQRILPHSEMQKVRDSVRVPLVGRIAAGEPILAEENIEEYFDLPSTSLPSGKLFGLTVSGDSMIEAGIFSDDVVIIRQQETVEQGDICAALVDDSATLKFFRREGNEVYLDPANERYEPIQLDGNANQNSILGKAVGLFRIL